MNETGSGEVDNGKGLALERFLSHPARSLFRLAFPIAIGMGIHVLYFLGDVYFVGRIGADAIAAVTFVTPFFFLMFSLSSIGIGAQSLLAQTIGAGDYEGVDRVSANTIFLALVFGTLLLVLGGTLSEDTLKLVGAQGTPLKLGARYFRGLSFCAPFLFFSAFSRALLVGQGNSKTPVIIMCLCTILNLLLDPLFIFVFDLGVFGAAMATLVSLLLSSCAFFHVLFLRRGSARITRFGFRDLSVGIQWRIIRVGLPGSFVQIVTSLGGIVFTRLISVFGADAVAAHGLGTRVDMLVVLPFIGISSALLTAVGMFYGASRYDLVRRVSIATIQWTTLAAALLGALIFVFAQPLVGVFTRDKEVIEIGASYLRYSAFSYPLLGFCMNGGRIFVALGKGMPGLVVMAIRLFMVSIPLTYFFTRILQMGVSSAWLAILLSHIVAATIFVVILVRHGNRLGS